MNDRVVTVAEGQIRWGYSPAATLRGCTVIRTEGRWTLAGTTVQTDAFRLSQEPLTFEVRHAKGTWRWPIVSIDMAPNQLRATLGPPEH